MLEVIRLRSLNPWFPTLLKYYSTRFSIDNLFFQHIMLSKLTETTVFLSIEAMNSELQDDEIDCRNRKERFKTEKPKLKDTLLSMENNNYMKSPRNLNSGAQSVGKGSNLQPNARNARRHVHFPTGIEANGKPDTVHRLTVDGKSSTPRRPGKFITKGRFAGLVATPIIEDTDADQSKEQTIVADSHSDSARSHSSCSNDTWDGKDSFLTHSRTDSADTNSVSDGGSWSGLSYGHSSSNRSNRVPRSKAVGHSDVIRKTLAKDFKDVMLRSRSEELKHKQKVCQYIAAEGKVRDYLLSTEKHLPYIHSSDNESSVCSGSNSTSSDVLSPVTRTRKTIRDLSSNILIRVFSNLSTRDLVKASAVCRKWYRTCWTPDLWSVIDLSGCSGDVNSVVENILRRLSKISQYACLVIHTWKLNSCKNLSDESLKLIGRRCPELKHMELAKCALITGAGVAEIFANCPNLSLLNIASCNEVASIDLSLQNGVSYGENASFLQLHYIDLSECLVDDAGLDMIARSCSFLEYLYLRRCEAITDKGLISVANYCTGIREMSVSDCSYVTDSGCKFLIKKCHDLRYISLAKCLITDDTLKHIARYCKKVRYLNLHMCHSISDEGVARIAQSCEKMRAVDIGKCEKLSDTSLNFISINCPHLRRLSVKGCDRITDSGLRKLATHCRSLKHLDVQECEFTFETYLYLRQRCVNCVIEHTKPEFY